jgi:biotin transport system substrate-specific component
MKPISEGIHVTKVLSAQSTSVSALPAPAAATSSLLAKTAVVVAGTALVAVSAQVSLPLYFTPVPLTLQTLAVLVLGLLLSPRLAAITLGAYLAEGALGLPVFAPGPFGSGLAHLVGPTGGYLLAYPLAAALTSYLWRRPWHGSPRGFATAAVSAALGSLPIFAFGALWLLLFSHAPIQSILTLTVFPFLPGDALKIVVAAALATGFVRLRPRTS